MMQKLTRIMGLLPIGLLLVISYGCSDSGSPTDGEIPEPKPGPVDTVSFANDVRPILAASCAITACHGSAPIQSGLNMGTATWSEIRAATGSVTGGLVVIAGNASISNLYLKTTSPPPFGVQMPRLASPLSSAQQIAIRDWINQGALDN